MSSFREEDAMRVGLFIWRAHTSLRLLLQQMTWVASGLLAPTN
jgi:hypothetical protein